MGYLSGALKALQEWGVDLKSADVTIGTSAGSIMASYLAAGWDTGDFYEYAHRRHKDVAKDPADDEEAMRQFFLPISRSRGERVRRSIGSFYALASSRASWPIRGWVPNDRLRRAFPSGLYATDLTRIRLYDDLPERWPENGLYICTADAYTGRRVAFGHPDAPPAPLPLAVLASCAIPGMFPPVKIDERHYVDGGVVSATSLDLAVEAGCRSILCVAPLGYRSEGEAILRDPKLWPAMFVRGMFARTLRKEVTDARAKGVEVLVVRPWVQELRAQGANSMRYYDRVAVADAAREGTLRLLERKADDPVLRAFSNGKRKKKRAV